MMVYAHGFTNHAYRYGYYVHGLSIRTVKREFDPRVADLQFHELQAYHCTSLLAFVTANVKIPELTFHSRYHRRLSWK